MVKNVVFKFANDWSMNLASMIAYNLITAIFPILLSVLSLIGFVLQTLPRRNRDDIANALSAALSGAFPNAGQNGAGIDVNALILHLVQITGPLAVAALIGLLWLGSNLFSNIENAFSIIFRIRGRDLVPQRLMAIGMVVLLALLLPLSLGASSLITTGSQDVQEALPQRLRGLGVALSYAGPLTSVGVLWLLFLMIYLVVPNFEVRLRQAWPGALVAAILFGLLQLLFPLYFKIFLSGNDRYGAAAAGILVIIIWLWFFALITVIGAQVNAVLMGLRSTPYDLARTWEIAYGQHDDQVEFKRKTTPTRLKRLIRQAGMLRPPQGDRLRRLRQGMRPPRARTPDTQAIGASAGTGASASAGTGASASAGTGASASAGTGASASAGTGASRENPHES